MHTTLYFSFIYMILEIEGLLMNFDDKAYIGAKIKIHRKKAGLTQEALAEKVNLSTQHISRIESGCYFPSLSSFFAIAEILKIDLGLFGYNVKNTSNPVKDKLIEEIVQADDKQLKLYKNVINAIKASL